MQNVCVFCGASAGKDPIYMEAAYQIGLLMAQMSLGLVYGGAQIGLMGKVADGVLAGGEKVVGVIPESFSHEVAHQGLTKLHIVDSMHARKAKMFDLADACIAMPGGFGTLEELSEVLTWAQLGFHQKPIGLLNINGYYDALLTFFNEAVASGFIKPKHMQMFVVHEDPATLLKLLKEFKSQA